MVAVYGGCLRLLAINTSLHHLALPSERFVVDGHAWSW